MAPRKPISGAPPAPAPAGPPPAWQPPGGAAPVGPGQTTFAPPPPRSDAPFVNAQWLWANGNQNDPMRSIAGTIRGLRQAVGGNPNIQQRPGYFLDITLDSGQKVTARIGVGDSRHEKLFHRYGNNIIGAHVVLRLTNPGDNSKAPWTLD